MKTVIAIDSFKGSLTTFESAEAVRDAILSVVPSAEVKICPLADGGEGTVRALTHACGGRLVTRLVTGPLGVPVEAEFGVIEKSGTAVIEMAAAAGITLVPEEKRNPLYTTTYGVGELILTAIREYSCRRFIIGIGGSATNDGGMGMLSALGFEFLDAGGAPVSVFGKGLADIKEIRADNAAPELSDCRFDIACDVKNPLCGALGCSRIFGAQKGADEKIMADMDCWLSSYAKLSKKLFPTADADLEGAGAAGGLGFAFSAYLGGRLTSGIKLVIDASGLEEEIKDADLVITGEGRLDGQSCMGKAPVGVALCAKKYGKPVIAFSGAVTRDAAKTNDYGIDAFFPILRAPCTLAEAMDTENAYRNLYDTAEQAIRLFLLSQSADKK